MIKLQANRFELNFLLKFSDLKSNFILNLGYFNPALNNLGLVYKNKISLSTWNACSFMWVFTVYYISSHDFH